jgi:hypothetical protein
MWIYQPSSVSTPEVEDSTSDSEWLFPMLAQSVTWRGTLRPAKSWSLIYRRGGWMTRRSGLIPEPLTASRGVEQWIGLLVASRANRGASQERSVEPKTNAGSGRTSDASLAKWNLEDSSWRTSQASFWEASSPYLESWPRTGTTRSGQLFALPTLVRRTAGNGALSWPTHTTNSATYSNGERGPNLIEAATNWPTASAQEAGIVEAKTKDGNSMSAGERAYSPNGVLVQRTLNRIATEWQTPASFQGKYRRQVNQTERAELLLPGQAEQWATPMASDDGKKVTVNSNQDGLIGQSYRFGRPDHKMPKGGDKSSQQTRRLNPRFVEMLMGWPLGWTDFASSATASCPSKQPSPSASSVSGC